MINFSSSYLNPGGYVKVYPPEAVTAVASLSGEQICLNGDIHRVNLGRPYPTLRKRHQAPVRSTGWSFFTNFKPGESPASLTVAAYSSETGTPLTSTNTVTAFDENFYVEHVPTGIPDYMTYRLAFIEGTNVIGVSGELVKVPLTLENVVEVEYRTERGLLKNFPYPYDELDRYNRVQMFGSMAGYEYPEEQTVYNEVTTGYVQKENSLLMRDVLFETYYFDFDYHEAAAVIFHHDDVKLNGKRYVSREAYKPNSEKNKDLTTGTVLLADSEFSERLRSC